MKLGRFRNTDPTGRRGERIAAKWLRRNRYRIIGRNVSVGVGEADIVCIAPDGRTLVIIEVKTRKQSDKAQPPPEASVGAQKQHKLRLVARAIARRPGFESRPVRIDVIGVELPVKGRPIVRHHASAVGG